MTPSIVLYLDLPFTTQVTSSAWLTAIHHFSSPRTPSEQKKGSRTRDNWWGLKRLRSSTGTNWGSTEHGGGAAYRQWCASRLGYLIRAKRRHMVDRDLRAELFGLKPTRTKATLLVTTQQRGGPRSGKSCVHTWKERDGYKEDSSLVSPLFTAPPPRAVEITILNKLVISSDSTKKIQRRKFLF